MVGDVVSPRSLSASLQVGIPIRVCEGAMARPEPSAGDAQLAGERGQTGNGPTGFPARLVFEHRASTQYDHGRSLRCVELCQMPNPFSWDARDGLSPLGSERTEVFGKGIEAYCVLSKEGGISQAFADNHIGHG